MYSVSYRLIFDLLRRVKRWFCAHATPTYDVNDSLKIAHNTNTGHTGAPPSQLKLVVRMRPGCGITRTINVRKICSAKVLPAQELATYPVGTLEKVRPWWRVLTLSYTARRSAILSEGTVGRKILTLRLSSLYPQRNPSPSRATHCSRNVEAVAESGCLWGHEKGGRIPNTGEWRDKVLEAGTTMICPCNKARYH